METKELAVLTEFNFGNEMIRTTTIEGEPMFCLRDVCDVLDIKQSANRQFGLEETDIYTIHVSTASGLRLMTFINESALNQIILQSRKPEALDMKRWVTSEVLPSIRKTGMYVSAPDQFQVLRGMLNVMEETTRKVDASIAHQEQIDQTLGAHSKMLAWLEEKQKHATVADMIRIWDLYPKPGVTKDLGKKAAKEYRKINNEEPRTLHGRAYAVKIYPIEFLEKCLAEDLRKIAFTKSS